MTENMRLFQNQNRLNKVISGMRVKADKKECNSLTELNNSIGVLYRFEDGQQNILTPEDKLSAPKFTPSWLI
jgi:hypothetical protein